MQEGSNWRFRALLDASLNNDITPRDMAHAWPDPGKKTDYRHLAQVGKDVEAEMSHSMLGERGDETYRQLSRADDVSMQEGDRTLSNGEIKEVDDKTLAAKTDHVCKRMLFAGVDREEVDVLFRNFLDETVMEGANQRRVARDAATVRNVNTRKGDLPVRQDDEFAEPVGQGGEIRDDRENYTTVPYDTEKHGRGARVTDEMLDQADIDAIEEQIRFIGEAAENAINRIFLTTLVDDAQYSVDRVAESDSPNYKALNRAIGRVDLADFETDSYVSHPGFRAALFEDEGIRFADRSGSDETVRERTFDPLLDLDHYGMSGRTYDDGESPRWDGGDSVWNYGDFYDDDEVGPADAGDVGAVAYDSSNIMIALYAPNGEDIEIKDYEDPIRDLQGVNSRIHVDTVYGQQRSAATVEWAE